MLVADATKRPPRLNFLPANHNSSAVWSFVSRSTTLHAKMPPYEASGESRRCSKMSACSARSPRPRHRLTISESARRVEPSFVGVQVFCHELKHADDRVVKNLLVTKVHPDGAHDESGNACLHPELPPRASGPHVAVGFRLRLHDPARDDAVGL